MSAESRLAALEADRDRLARHLTDLYSEVMELREEFVEHRRDAGRMQRLWIYLGRKHGWLDR